MDNGNNEVIIHAFCHLRAWVNNRVRIDFGFYHDHEIEGPLARGASDHYTVPIKALPETIAAARLFTKEMADTIKECCTRDVFYDINGFILVCYAIDEDKAVQVIEKVRALYEKQEYVWEVVDLSQSYLGLEFKKKPDWVKTITVV
ncbi:MAG: hypothetical protein IKE91_07715 [Clostridia bacterium]|nr:hypothetical protein [Clostridia bacterium]